MSDTNVDVSCGNCGNSLQATGEVCKKACSNKPILGKPRLPKWVSIDNAEKINYEDAYKTKK